MVFETDNSLVRQETIVILVACTYRIEMEKVDFMLNKIYYSLSMVVFVLNAVVAFYALRFGDVFAEEGIQLLFLDLTGAGVTLMGLLNVNSKHSLFTIVVASLVLLVVFYQMNASHIMMADSLSSIQGSVFWKESFDWIARLVLMMMAWSLIQSLCLPIFFLVHRFFVQKTNVPVDKQKEWV